MTPTISVNDTLPDPGTFIIIAHRHSSFYRVSLSVIAQNYLDLILRTPENNGRKS